MIVDDLRNLGQAKKASRGSKTLPPLQEADDRGRRKSRNVLIMAVE